MHNSHTAQAVLNDYETLSDWNDLPKVKNFTPGIASSYDRLGGNQDYNYYLQPAGFQNTDTNTVVTQLAGPGIITRFWMPHFTANVGFPVKITIDGNTVINTTSNNFLDGTYSYISSPFVYTLIGGQVSYEPIGFQNSIKIESHNSGTGTRHYYQYNYVKLPIGQQVRAYCGTLSFEQLSARNAAAEIIRNAGLNPAGITNNSVTITKGETIIAPGSATTLCDISAAGTIRSLNLKVPTGITDIKLENLRLRISYDNLANYAIDVPVAHFFGAGFGRVPYKSLPIGTDSPDGFYCYWPIPFKQAVHVEIYNSGSDSIAIDSAKVQYELGAVTCDSGYLHAVYNKEVTVYGQPFHILLSTQGQGHYIGNLLYVEHTGDYRSMLEADDIVVVNPNKPSQIVLNGTGMEDAYNGGYFYNHVAEQNNDGETADPTFGIRPFSGLLYIDFYDMPGYVRTRTDQYRWLIADCVPFTDGIDVKIENYGSVAGTTYGSTAFYYLLPAYFNFKNFALFSAHWLESSCIAPDWCNGNDFDKDGAVNWFDLTAISDNWLTCNFL